MPPVYHSVYYLSRNIMKDAKKGEKVGIMEAIKTTYGDPSLLQNPIRMSAKKNPGG
jgi:hypothetical protein